ncbi:MAG: hypothetical protein FJ086_13090, partial [Deltaproteobacteria bacterium]|nr:hypothetical protein [Deltaproteobacteria bacterium]
GPGQRALLSAAVEPVGTGPALDVALAYLAASGLAVRCAGAQGAFGTWNPDALEAASRTVAVQLGSAPARLDGARGPAVWMGAGPGGGLRVVALPAAGCGRCATRAVTALGPIPAGPPSVLVGAQAALAVQRLVMGWHGAAASVLEVSAGGEALPAELKGCEEHPG